MKKRQYRPFPIKSLSPQPIKVVAEKDVPMQLIEIKPKQRGIFKRIASIFKGRDKTRKMQSRYRYQK